MKKQFVLFLILVVAIKSWSQSAEQNVAAAVTAFNNAIVAADSTTLNKLTAGALSYGHSSGTVEDRQTFVTNVIHGTLKMTSITTADQTVTIQKRIALVRHRFTAQAINNGTPTELKLSVLQIWQKAHGQWKLLARQSCKL